MDPNIKQSIVDRLKQTNNVLVTVKSNPTVDQLAACIGLTIFLNKQGKHATAVFSGEVPSTIEFLKPEATLEKNTNSLRDFIIALDKSKADKLRYKVEDKVVKIFITPYKTSISQDDLNFSQGDFNVDVVIALGVHGREELDQAIMAHGRILHDATVISVNNNKPADLGALNWNDSKASSLSEMSAGLVESLQANLLDAQIATAFLTGIVAETARFSNTKTTSNTMNLSAKLMAAGANQQLVATKLEEPVKIAQPATQAAGKNGELEIAHPEPAENNEANKTETIELPPPAASETHSEDGEIFIDENGNFKTGLQDDDDKKADDKKPAGRLALDPPTMGGALTANTQAHHYEPNIDPLSVKSPNDAVLTHGGGEVPENSQKISNKGLDLKPTQTLSSIEEQVESPHVTETSVPSPHEDGIKPLTSPQNGVPPSLNPLNGTNEAINLPSVEPQLTSPTQSLEDARKAVESAAFESTNQTLEPLQSINSQPLGGNLNNQNDLANTPIASQLPTNTNLPPNLSSYGPSLQSDPTGVGQPATPPPPVPPPMMPPNFAQPPSSNNNGSSAPL